jgi:molybdenum cofactor cytidylyltransferase
MDEYGFIIVAAGSSSRLGRAKQLLPFNGKSLLEHTVETALQTNKGPVLCVLGANAEPIRNVLSRLPVTLLINESWEEGMGASIRCGVKGLLKLFPDIKGAILLVSDQPFISSSLLNQLIATHESSGKQIVASHYNNTVGVPVLFSNEIFPELLVLEGQQGGKKILFSNNDRLTSVDFQKGNIDIDTVADYDRLIGPE